MPNHVSIIFISTISSHLNLCTVSGKLRKVPSEDGRGGIIYRPIENCPCAYEPYLSYTDFINHVLKGDGDYLAAVRRYDEIMKYMCKYSDESLPCMTTDKNLISFTNGVLSLSPRVFHLYTEPLPESVSGHIARHHISSQYTGSTDTPLMDQILQHQFEDGDGRIEQLFATIGRTFFKIRERDHWDVVAILLGRGQGKSTIMSVIAALFNPRSVAELDSSHEKMFGLQSTLGKELVMISDAPEKIFKVLSQDVFQKMVSGGEISVNIKYKPTIVCTWTTPLFIASSVMLDYDDDEGEISRRLVIFPFENFLNPGALDTTLSNRIISSELPNIVARSLQGN